MSEYTKGPWRQQLESEFESTREVLAPNGECVANVWPNRPSLPVEVNARLIAASPDLLEAAKYVRAQANEAIGNEPYTVSPGGFYRLQAAIDKAEGNA